MGTDPDVVVIGAGFAGLSAATRLAEAGRRVLVLEARPSAGGRATAFTDPATGERVDNGQHILVGGYHETFRFLRRIGAADDVYVQRALEIEFVDSEQKRSRLFCPALPPPLHLLAGVVGWGALSWRDRTRLLGIGSALRHTEAPGHRGAETVRQWLDRRGQTSRAVEMLWEPLAVAALNEPIDRAAAAPFVEVLRRMFGARARDAALALPRRPLDELYVTPAIRFIESRGGRVRLNTAARVTRDAMGLSVRVRDAALRAPVVICAVPWFSLAETLVDPGAGLQRILEHARGTAASPIVTVNLWFDRRVTDAAFIGLPGRAMQWVFDKRVLFGDEASHLSLVSSAAESLVGLGNDDVVAVAMREIAAALPAVRTAQLRRAVVVRERRATFSVAPGQPPRPSTLTDVPGLLLAGDWIDTGLPATIESAVISGHWAADAVMCDR